MFLLAASYFQFTFISVVIIFLTPYYIAVPLVIILWLIRFLFLITSNAVLLPFEKRSNEKKINSAKAKLTSLPNLVTIGIAGSSGKSSIKEILHNLLSENTLMTSQSENTLMSTVETIENKLNKDYRYLICEMNAYKNGDIRKTCELVDPKIGILPAINEQHLERFKSVENTVKTKFELLRNLKNEGVGIVSLDEHLINDNLKKALPTQLIGYTLENGTSELCRKVVSADNISMDTKGASFSLTISDEEYFFESPLLGKNHLGNLLASIICAIEMGEKPANLVDMVRNLPQIPDRLEYKTYENIHILDDTQSSNVSGLKDALVVLSMFGGKKVIATPGIAEIGHKSDDVHKLLGYLASQVADLILLIGKADRTDNIRFGALDNSFRKEDIIRLRNISEVYSFVDKNLKEGDVVLLENDLPERFL